MGNGGTGNPLLGPPLVKDVVPEESVDHVANGDGQGGGCDVQRPKLQPPMPFMTGPLLRRQGGNLHGSERADDSVHLLGVKVGDENCRVPASQGDVRHRSALGLKLPDHLGGAG